MKHFFLILLATLITLSCKTSDVGKNKFSNKVKEKFEVLKIDSIETNYLIYVKRNDSIFKIASTKKDTTSCEKIRIGKSYTLKLKSVFPPNYYQKLDIAGIKFNGSMIKLEKGDGVIWDLFVSENLNSLCYLEL